jgi:hypothetical protein
VDEVLGGMEAGQFGAGCKGGNPALGFRRLARLDRKPGLPSASAADNAAHRDTSRPGAPFCKLPQLGRAPDQGRRADVGAEQFDQRSWIGLLGVQTVEL